jgi:phosphatidylserine decarboxylase
VNGKIVRTVLVPGTYYAESPTMGFQSEVIDTFGTIVDAKESGTNIGDDGKPSPDPAGPNNSQGFITSTAARALVYIEADNSDIGLMCFMAVGMAEVSTNEITVQPGQVVKKGDQLGTFHFGGSTHCLIFRRETKIEFVDNLPTDKNIDLNTVIAKVFPSDK